MASSGKQVKNGKAFEYAIASQYYNYLLREGVNAILEVNAAFQTARSFYLGMDSEERNKFDKAACNTISTLVKIEPGLITNGKGNDVLKILLNEDSVGEDGDVRDVLFLHNSPDWEIGFSAKNNNDAVKNSRLAKDLDFAKSWVDIPCSEEYWKTVRPIFDYLQKKRDEGLTWNDLGHEKELKVYVPLLCAFRDEILRIANSYPGVPEKLIEYLIGTSPFYKIIKDDKHNLVIVKAFNVKGRLNKTFNGVKSQYKVPKINLPSRIVEFDFKPKSSTTLNMILDGGWEISFRIHNASSLVETSLKFDIKLLGNPPVLFTQHIFQ